MDKEFEKIIEDFKKVSLTKEESSLMSSNITSLMSYHPVRQAGVSRLIVQRSSLLLFFNFRNKIMPIALIIALVLSGSVSFAAERALPGDALYTVKVSVNEEVRGWVALTSESKAELASRLAERRLEEAETLALAGELKADIREKLEANFNKQTERAEERIQKFEDSGNLEVAARLSSVLEASLKTHDKILARVDEGSNAKAAVSLSASADAKVSASAENNGSEIRILKAVVQSRAERIESIREKIEHKISTTTDEANLKAQAEGRVKAAENKVAEVESFAELKKGELEASIYAEIEANLAEIKGSIREAKSKLSGGDYKASIKLSLEAFRSAQELKTVIIFKSNPGSGSNSGGFIIDVESLINMGPNNGASVISATEVSTGTESSAEIKNDNAEVKNENRVEVNLPI